MRISKNKFVSVTYDLNVGNEDDLELMERATEERPLRFIFGTDTMLPAFEEELNGLEQGSMFEFTLDPKHAYGEYVEENVIELPKNIFEVDGKFDDEYVKEGAILPMTTANGERMNGSVLEVKENVVVMDFNHPLAGETLHFNGEVIDVHEPTEAEIIALNQAMSGGCNCEGCGDCNCGCDCGNEGRGNEGYGSDCDCDCGCKH
jgi:FKBP-type peptidyl-prolyl cis-trans isomerase SlyD